MKKRITKKSLKKALQVITDLGRSPYLSSAEDWVRARYTLADKVVAGIQNTCYVHRVYGLRITKSQVNTLRMAAEYINWSNLCAFVETSKGLWRDELKENLKCISWYERTLAYFGRTMVW